MSKAYYNEIEPFCVEWLRNLMAEGLIVPPKRIWAKWIERKLESA